MQFHPEVEAGTFPQLWSRAGKPELVDHYHALPGAKRLLQNFLRAAAAGTSRTATAPADSRPTGTGQLLAFSAACVLGSLLATRGWR